MAYVSTQTSLYTTLRSHLDNYFLVLVLNILMNYSDYFGVVAAEVQVPVEALVVVLALKIPHHWIPKKSFLYLRKKFREDPRNNKNVKDLSVDVAVAGYFFFFKKIRGMLAY